MSPVLPSGGAPRLAPSSPLSRAPVLFGYLPHCLW